MGYIKDEVMADSPWVYWPLDDAGGTVAADYVSTRDATATHSGILGAADADFGTVAGLNGTSNYLYYGASGVAALACEAWFRSDVAYTAGAPEYYAILSGVGPGDGNGVWIGEVTGSLTNEVLTFANRNIGDRYWSYTGAGITLAANTWHHVVAVRSTPDSDWAVYLNAVKVSNVRVGSAETGALSWNDFYIGRLHHHPSGYFDGKIAHVAFYDTELSAARILAHYNASKLPLPGGWHLSEVRLRGGQIAYGDLRGGQQWR